MDRTVRDVVRRGMNFSQRSTQSNVSASKIRKSFLDFFCAGHDHFHIFSSPVFSLKDPTLAFVNAGMNQFKDVFLGLIKPEFTRVANWQKCIRVGGKHNDLGKVGLDGTHHTFFEMLGNWSFGDYFKSETCRMSWELLTKVYELPPERLYVTYFQGDKSLGLDPDEELRDIWREIGVKDSHILPFGNQDNFWEGSLTGPCGPCSEIHFDHCPGRTNAGALVNTGDPSLTELWNLVFIQYNRLPKGSLQKLPQHFVDTGMGFERLVAVLQGKTSNYDTDLFHPLFQAIQKYSDHQEYTGKYDGNPYDNAYRILADHSRMLTVALSDGMIPSHEYKIRKVLRRALGISEEIFGNKSGLLKELSCYVVETLSDGYPHMGNNLEKIHNILDYEEENLKQQASFRAVAWKKLKQKYPLLGNLKVTDLADVYNAYQYLEKKILSNNRKEISAEDTWILFNTYGISENVTQHFAEALDLHFNKNEYEHYKLSLTNEDRKRQYEKFQEVREGTLPSSVLNELEKMNLEPTLDLFKYDYRVDSSGKYVFNKQPATIEAIIYGDQVLNEITVGNVKEREVGLILDRTQLFSEEGNQCSDTGTLLIEGEILFDISRVEKIKGLAVHFGTFRDFLSISKVSINDIGVIEIDEKRRLNIMRNHTALHLLNAAVNNMFTPSGEKFSKVSHECMELHTRVYRNKFNKEAIISKLYSLSYYSIEKIKTSYLTGGHPRFLGGLCIYQLKMLLTEFDGKTFGMSFNKVRHSDLLTTKDNGIKTTKKNDLIKIENYVREFIIHGVSVKRKILTYPEFQKVNDIVFIPGESILSSEIPVIEMNSGFKLTKEYCTGTHVLNTADLKDFVVVDYRDYNKVRIFKALTGEEATKIRENDTAIKIEWQTLQKKISIVSDSDIDSLILEVKSFEEKVANTILSTASRNRILISSANAKRDLRLTKTFNKRKNIEREIRKAIEMTDQNFVVHLMQNLETNGETNFKDFKTPKPLMIFLRRENLVKVFCAVPKEFVSKNFSAKIWLMESMISFSGNGYFDKNKSYDFWYAIKELELTEEQETMASKLARKFAEEHFNAVKSKLQRSLY